MDARWKKKKKDTPEATRTALEHTHHKSIICNLGVPSYWNIKELNFQIELSAKFKYDFYVLFFIYL